jgi:hypothetical protein
MMPPVGGLNRALEAEISASTGANAVLQVEWQVLPALCAGWGERGKQSGCN